MSATPSRLGVTMKQRNAAEANGRQLTLCSSAGSELLRSEIAVRSWRIEAEHGRELGGDADRRAIGVDWR